jgi:hypothetical protein
MAHVTMMIKLDDMDGETRAERRDSANTFYEAIRVLAGVTLDVNETDDGYLISWTNSRPTGRQSRSYRVHRQLHHVCRISDDLV